MRIVFRIGKSMVHAVQDAVGTRAHVRRTLHNKRKPIKDFFPAAAHGKSAMSGIAVHKKRLGKKGQVPVCNKENEYGHR